MFGPRQDARSPYSGVIALFIAAMNQGRAPTIFGDGLQTRDFVYVENVVQALILAAEARRVGKVYNIGNGQSSTLLDLVRHLNELLASKIEPKFEPSRPGDIRHSAADISRARRDLAYEPRVSFREGLAALSNGLRVSATVRRRKKNDNVQCASSLYDGRQPRDWAKRDHDDAGA